MSPGSYQGAPCTKVSGYSTRPTAYLSYGTHKKSHPYQTFYPGKAGTPGLPNNHAKKHTLTVRETTSYLLTLLTASKLLHKSRLPQTGHLTRTTLEPSLSPSAFSSHRMLHSPGQLTAHKVSGAAAKYSPSHTHRRKRTKPVYRGRNATVHQKRPTAWLLIVEDYSKQENEEDLSPLCC